MSKFIMVNGYVTGENVFMMPDFTLVKLMYSAHARLQLMASNGCFVPLSGWLLEGMLSGSAQLYYTRIRAFEARTIWRMKRSMTVLKWSYPGHTPA
ncbi:hypothetical protein [Dyadobacter aurulentus]|uniref:hypothetical protein n=1 Tax=Dyadobacter sp. UC 10 TaxID=2605428 RepID=UPI0011F37B67|nr:hypothetical protein [Dyadobacter sp. UC 10]KAA0992281.1 hypothetical protein FXO21_19910 [Dyadobacter sp. UC 10]